MQKLITTSTLNVNGRNRYSVLVSDIVDGWYVNTRRIVESLTIKRALIKFNETKEKYPNAIIHTTEWSK